MFRITECSLAIIFKVSTKPCLSAAFRKLALFVFVCVLKKIDKYILQCGKIVSVFVKEQPALFNNFKVIKVKSIIIVLTSLAEFIDLSTLMPLAFVNCEPIHSYCELNVH